MTGLPPQITAQVLKQAVPPAAQKTEDSLASLHSSESGQPRGAAAGEGPEGAQLGGCRVKKEPEAEAQEMGERGGSWRECGQPSPGGDPEGLQSRPPAERREDGCEPCACWRRGETAAARGAALTPIGLTS